MVYQVLICDDSPDMEQEKVSKLREVAPSGKYSVIGRETLSKNSVEDNSDFDSAVKVLRDRRKAARDGNDDWLGETCLFDRTDILVLDYDLLEIDTDQTRLTGEGLARLVRTFSTCGVVVVFNQFVGQTFDLNLRGNLWSYADLNVHADSLLADGLWGEPPWQGFRPWSWQTMGDAVGTQKSRQRVISENFDTPIVSVLQFEDEEVARLSSSTFNFVWSNAQSVADVQEFTFRQYISDKAADLDTHAVATATDKSARDTLIPRLAGARIGKWLEREVLGAQEILVDIPHLIQRYPFVLGDDQKELEAWNKAIHDIEMMRDQVPEDCWYQPADFLTRPAIWLDKFKADTEVSTAINDFDYFGAQPFVFLEDTSSFAPIEHAQEFRAAYHNLHDTRFVAKLPTIEYRPRSRFALGD